MDKIHEIACDPMCGFSIRSHDEKEVIDMAGKHVKTKHKMNTTPAELKKMMKSM